MLTDVLFILNITMAFFTFFILLLAFISPVCLCDVLRRAVVVAGRGWRGCLLRCVRDPGFHRRSSRTS